MDHQLSLMQRNSEVHWQLELEVVYINLSMVTTLCFIHENSVLYGLYHDHHRDSPPSQKCVLTLSQVACTPLYLPAVWICPYWTARYNCTAGKVRSSSSFVLISKRGRLIFLNCWIKTSREIRWGCSRFLLPEVHFLTCFSLPGAFMLLKLAGFAPVFNQHEYVTCWITKLPWKRRSANLDGCVSSLRPKGLQVKGLFSERIHYDFCDGCSRDGSLNRLEYGTPYWIFMQALLLHSTK